ncbi:MAG: MFS transporter, partial [Caulobacteraceae bacterium]
MPDTDAKSISPESARALFAIPAFRLFWAARFCDLLAVQIQAVTLAWQVYAVARISHNVPEAALMVGFIGLAQFLPLFALTLNAGAAADRNDRRVIMMLCVGVEIACSVGLALYAFSHREALWPIFAAAAAFGAARAFFSPSSTALAPTLVPRALLPRAIAWNSLNWQSASIIGPAIGGLLCALSPAVAYSASAGLYGLSLLLLVFLKSPARPEPVTASRVALIKEG